MLKNIPQSLRPETPGQSL